MIGLLEKNGLLFEFYWEGDCSKTTMQISATLIVGRAFLTTSQTQNVTLPYHLNKRNRGGKNCFGTNVSDAKKRKVERFFLSLLAKYGNCFYDLERFAKIETLEHYIDYIKDYVASQEKPLHIIHFAQLDDAINDCFLDKQKGKKILRYSSILPLMFHNLQCGIFLGAFTYNRNEAMNYQFKHLSPKNIDTSSIDF